MLKIDKITKKFGNKQILFDISTEISHGEIVWILGPNGAGKSTLMRIITGYYFPDSGDVLIDGRSVFSDTLLKKKIGYLPEVNPLYEEMGVDEFLCLIADLKSCPQPKIEAVLAMTGLTEKRTNLIQTLSKGYRQRVGIAASLIGDPDILILDEPTEWLDPGQRDEIKNLIRSLWKEKTVLVSSHVLGELSDLVSRVIIIDEGKIKLDDTLANITQARGDRFRFEVHMTGRRTIPDLRESFPEIIEIHHHDNILEIHSSVDIRQTLLPYLVQHLNVVEFFSEKVSLSDVFFETIK